MSDEDEDWFERALRESAAEDGDAAETAAEDGEAAESEARADDGAAADAESEVSAAGSAATDDPDAGGDAPDGRSPFEELDGAGSDASGDLPPTEGADDAGSESPFDEDFASAFEGAPGPGGDGGSAPGGGGGGFGGGAAGPSDDGFEDAEFESTIPRIDLGIEGLDEMILGGVPERSLIAVVGSAGTGKTTFSLQFLERALSEGERAVFLTLEESSDRVVDTAEEKGWPFRTHVDEGRLSIVHLDPIEMVNSLSSIRSELPELVDAFDADRLVLDSVSLLEMMYDHSSDRRSEVYQFTRSLKEAGVTTLVTSEASGDNPYNSRYGIIEYLADAVFVLQYVRPSDFQETRLSVEIQKIRDANHSRQMKPYEITDAGIKVYRQANLF